MHMIALYLNSRFSPSASCVPACLRGEISGSDSAHPGALLGAFHLLFDLTAGALLVATGGRFLLSGFGSIRSRCGRRIGLLSGGSGGRSCAGVLEGGLDLVLGRRGVGELVDATGQAFQR